MISRLSAAIWLAADGLTLAPLVFAALAASSAVPRGYQLSDAIVLAAVVLSLSAVGAPMA